MSQADNLKILGSAILPAALIAWFLFLPGLPRWLDWHVHLCWIHGFDQALRDGVAYPRWIDTPNAGLGAPVFLYYPPLTYYLTSLIQAALGVEASSSLKLVIALAWLSLGFGSYSWLRLHCNRPWALVLSTLICASPAVVAPQLIFAMPATAVAMGLCPWLFWLIERHPKAGKFNWLLIALCFAALLVSHLLTVVAVGALIALLLTRTRATQPTAGTASSAIMVGLLLAAPYWYNALSNTGLVYFEHLTEGKHFQIASNLIAPLRTDPLLAFPRFSTFFWLTSAFFFGSAALILCAVIRERNIATTGRLYRALEGPGLVILALFLASTTSAWLYDLLPLFKLMQFGWRWLPLALFALGLSLAQFLGKSRQDEPANRVVVAAIVLGIGLPAAYSIFFILRLDHGQPGVRTSQQEESTATKQCVWNTLEHRPMAMGAAWNNPIETKPGALEVMHGRVHVLRTESHAHYRLIEVVADVPSRVQLSALRFPGWHLTANGEPLNTAPGPGGTLEFYIPNGRFELELIFDAGETTEGGWWIMSIGLLALFAMLVHRESGKNRTMRTSKD